MEDVGQQNRLLQWTDIDDLYFTSSYSAVGLVHRRAHDCFEWFVLVGEKVCWSGERTTLHSAMAHVEGHFVGYQHFSGSSRPSAGGDGDELSDCAAE